MKRPIESRIVFRLLRDLTDRRGLRQAWDAADDAVRREITREWVKIVREELERERTTKGGA